MKSVVLFLALSLILAGCAPSARLSVEPRSTVRVSSWSPYPALKSDIDALIPDSVFPPASIGIAVRSLRTGETLYALNAANLFVPASNEKLLTAATTLTTLGKNFRFATRLFMDTVGTAHLYLKGSGDPLLQSSDLDSLARLVVPLLPAGKRWTLCADQTLFDDIPWGKGWMWDDEPSSDGMFISPLSINSNCVRVTATPASSGGAPPVVTIDPATSYVTVSNTAVTVDDSVRQPLEISRDWMNRTNTITVKGEILRTAAPARDRISVRDPGWYALTLLRESLALRGIQDNGMLADSVPARAIELARFERGLDSVLTTMNKISDNLSAEDLFKLDGATVYGVPGTGDKGIAAVKGFLGAHGIDTNAIVIADGSGVSRYNLVSPATLVRLLALMANDTLWVSTLPIAGVDGTLSGRMRRTAAEGNARAKTGTLDGVATLSGYLHTADGEPLAFSIMTQNAPEGPHDCRGAQDAIVALLCRMRRSDF